MPLLQLHTNADLPDDRRNELLASLSKTVAETIGKPEEYVMVTIAPAHMTMSGQAGDAAFVDVRSIGALDGDVCPTLARKISELLRESLGVSPDRVFLNFTDVPAQRWGWKESTIG